MEKNEEIIDVLNDLIQINNDRVTGYERAASEIQNSEYAEITSLFFKMTEDSRTYKNDLIDAVISLGGEPATDTTMSGKIYRMWMDLKVSFSGNDLRAVLESCEFGEDAALRAYQDALQTELSWPQDLLTLVSNQRQEIRTSHDRIKRYRDEFRNVEDLKT
ncbi:MAG TPA: PA2169 family four-helix-bundle protein [Ohtaekwangia sp.]|nr:PA2169 family four-helix-bundle protein [Ohtaekwangia sp.]